MFRVCCTAVSSSGTVVPAIVCGRCRSLIILRMLFLCRINSDIFSNGNIGSWDRAHWVIACSTVYRASPTESTVFITEVVSVFVRASL